MSQKRAKFESKIFLNINPYPRKNRPNSAHFWPADF